MKHLTPIKAIRQKCLDCCCDSAKEVKECNIPNCSLYKFRMGKNPNIDRSSKKGLVPSQFLSKTAD